MTKPRFRIQSRERQRNYDSIPDPSYPYPRLQPARLSAIARPATMCCRGGACFRSCATAPFFTLARKKHRPTAPGRCASCSIFARNILAIRARGRANPSSSPVGSSSSRARKALKIASRPRLSDATARETRSRSNCSLMFAVVRAGTKNNAAGVNKAGEIHAMPQRSGRGCVFC